MRQKILVIGGIVLVAVVIEIGLYIDASRDLANAPAPDSQAYAVAVSFTEIARGAQSSVTSRVNYLITSASQLEKLWEMTDATSTPPAVDFEEDAVIAVFAGERPTAGSAIAVSQIKDSDARRVTVELSEPAAGCVSAQVLTAPYEIIVVPATTLPLAHEDTETTVGCKD